MNKLLSVLLLSVFCINASAQNWVEIMHDPNLSFLEKKTAFNSYWENREYEKGKGYKQFERWAWFIEKRLDEQGKFSDAAATWKVYEKNRKKYGSSLLKSGNWSPLGPFEWEATGWNPGIGRVNVIKQDPIDNNTIYVGTPAGGLWRSNTNGTSWLPLTDELPTLGVSAIEIDPLDNNIIYIGTGDGDGGDTYSVGVLKSIDGGTSWNLTGLSFDLADFLVVRKLVMHPSDNNILFAATNDGIYRTSDAGENWISVLGGSMREVQFHPNNPEIVYACSDRFFKSSDGGFTFSSVTEGLPNQFSVNRLAMGISPDEPDWVYILGGDQDNSGFYGMYRSTDIGETFELRVDTPNVLGWSYVGSDEGGQSWYDLTMTVNPNNANHIYTGGVNLWESFDGGQTFEINAHWLWPTDSITNYVHADIHTLSFVGNELFCGSDGGVFRSTNFGETWEDLSNGLAISQFYRLGTSQTSGNKIMTGAQDNGTYLLDNGVWTHVIGADGMEAIVDPLNENILYGATQRGNIRKSEDGGENFYGISGSVDETGAWVTPYQLNPQNFNRVIAAWENVWAFNIADTNWTQLSNVGGATISSLRVAPTDSNFIYISQGNIIRSTNTFGTNWDIISAGLPSQSVSYLEVHPDDPETIFVAYSGFNEGERIYKTTDGGNSWQNITLNLPAIPINCITYENGSDGALYIGTDLGAYYTDDNLANWVPFSDGLPNVIVNELEIQYSEQKIRAATFGRGIWESDLYTPELIAPLADFKTLQPVICQGDSSSFIDLSLYNTPNWFWEFEGGTPSTSTASSPWITYNDPGLYQVKLTVENAFGVDSIVKTEYITVLPIVGYPSPFHEDYELVESLPNEAWFIANEENDITWEITDEYAFSGVKSMWIDNFQNSAGRIDEFISNTIDLEGVDDMILTFKVAFAQKNQFNEDRLEVYASSDCGANFVLRKVLQAQTNLSSAPPVSDPFYPNSNEWQEITITNINSGFWVSNFRMKFLFDYDGGNNIYIDDINIDLAIGLENLISRNLNLKLFPNPADEELNLEFNLLRTHNVQIILRDALGRAVHHLSSRQFGFGEHAVKLDTETFGEGLYFLELLLDDQSFVEKVIIH